MRAARGAVSSPAIASERLVRQRLSRRRHRHALSGLRGSLGDLEAEDDWVSAIEGDVDAVPPVLLDADLTKVDRQWKQ